MGERSALSCGGWGSSSGDTPDRATAVGSIALRVEGRVAGSLQWPAGVRRAGPAADHAILFSDLHLWQMPISCHTCAATPP